MRITIQPEILVKHLSYAKCLLGSKPHRFEQSQEFRGGPRRRHLSHDGKCGHLAFHLPKDVKAVANRVPPNTLDRSGDIALGCAPTQRRSCKL
jgi:hypothetical protein